jgi:hypothetical protein
MSCLRREFLEPELQQTGFDGSISAQTRQTPRIQNMVAGTKDQISLVDRPENNWGPRMPYAKIDAHHHLWKYSAPQYPWISENMGLLRRDFLIQDLMDVLDESDIDGVVTVQARQALAETRWLLDLARTHDVIRAVVGWVALTDPKVERDLEHFSTHAKLKGLRHVLHDCTFCAKTSTVESSY